MMSSIHGRNQPFSIILSISRHQFGRFRAPLGLYHLGPRQTDRFFGLGEEKPCRSADVGQLAVHRARCDSSGTRRVAADARTDGPGPLESTLAESSSNRFPTRASPSNSELKITMRSQHDRPWSGNHAPSALRQAPRRRRRRKLWVRHRPWLELLENRQLLSSISWINPNGGDWDVASNWVNAADSTDHHVPIANDDAQINTAGITITHSTGTSDSVHSVYSKSLIDLGGARSPSVRRIQIDSNTDPLKLSGGILRGATVVAGTTVQASTSGGTLDHVTLNGNLDLSTVPDAAAAVTGGLTLNGVAVLGRADGTTNGSLYFIGAETLGGTGSVLFGANGSPSIGDPHLNQILNSSSGAGDTGTLTIGPGILIHGQGGYVGGGTNPLIINGTIAADVAGGPLSSRGPLNVLFGGAGSSVAGALQASNGGVLVLQGSGSNGLTSSSTITVGAGSSLSINTGPLTLNDPGILDVQPGGTFSVSGGLIGGTRDSSLYQPLGTVQLNGSGTSSAPQQFEVMGQDLGNVSAGFVRNFAYGTLALASNNDVRLVDNAHNSSGTGPEALYVNSLLVPSGSTLDLNGLHLYVRSAQVNGTIVGGSLTRFPAGGPLTFATPTSGTLQIVGELDDWTIFGRANQSLAVIVNTGSGGNPAPLPPSLNYAQVQVVDASGNVLATASNSQYGANATLLNVTLPADGTYHIQVSAPAGQSSSTGNYVLTAYDATVHVAPVELNQNVTSQLATPYSLDRWTFSAVAGQQIRFDLLNATSPSILFDLNGPGGTALFTGLSSNSDLITLTASGTYTLTVHGSQGQTGAYAFQLAETSVTDLTLGTPYQGTLVGSARHNCSAWTSRISNSC